MTTWRPAGAAREVGAAVRASPVHAAVSALISAAMIALCLLTAGRAAAAEAAVLSRIDDAGARSIVLRATQDGAGLDPGLVRSLQQVHGVQQVLGVGPAQDATAGSVLTSRPPVAVRPGWGLVGGLDLQQWRSTWDATWHGSSDEPPALATDSARTMAGLLDPVGPLRLRDGQYFTVVGPLSVEGLSALEPLVVVPATADADAELVTIVITTRTAADIGPVTGAVRGLLTGRDPARISLSTSQALADLTSLVQGDLAGYGRSSVLLVLLVGLVVESLVVLAWIASRRRDIGRRRALGATRTLAATLLLGQVGVASAAGAAVGGMFGVILVNRLTGSAVPLPFALAVATLTILTTLVGALTPVVSAVHRDPVRVLRQP